MKISEVVLQWSRRNRRVTLRWMLVLEFYFAFTMLLSAGYQ